MYGIETESHLGGYIVGLTNHGDPNTYATEVWDWMYDNGIRSVIDVGCGEGHSTKYFLDKGIRAIGIEGGKNAYENSPVINHLILHDYTTAPLILPDSYDCVWSCEFVEHVESKYVNNFLATFLCAKSIFLTHALPGQPGYHHVNCQPASYWIDKIETLGFSYNIAISNQLRALTNKMHVKNTLLYFQK
jgi:hypothetical protein